MFFAFFLWKLNLSVFSHVFIKKMQFFSTSYVQFWIVESKKFLEWLFNSTFALFLSLYFCNESFVNAALGYYYSYTLCNSCISPPSRRNISWFKEFHPRKKLETLEIVEQSICKPMYNYDQVSRENAKYHLECEYGWNCFLKWFSGSNVKLCSNVLYCNVNLIEIGGWFKFSAS